MKGNAFSTVIAFLLTNASQALQAPSPASACGRRNTPGITSQLTTSQQQRRQQSTRGALATVDNHAESNRRPLEEISHKFLEELERELTQELDLAAGELFTETKQLNDREIKRVFDEDVSAEIFDGFHEGEEEVGGALMKARRGDRKGKRRNHRRDGRRRCRSNTDSNVDRTLTNRSKRSRRTRSFGSIAEGAKLSGRKKRSGRPAYINVNLRTGQASASSEKSARRRRNEVVAGKMTTLYRSDGSSRANVPKLNNTSSTDKMEQPHISRRRKSPAIATRNLTNTDTRGNRCTAGDNCRGTDEAGGHTPPERRLVVPLILSLVQPSAVLTTSVIFATLAIAMPPQRYTPRDAVLWLPIVHVGISVITRLSSGAWNTTKKKDRRQRFHHVSGVKKLSVVVILCAAAYVITMTFTKPLAGLTLVEG